MRPPAGVVATGKWIMGERIQAGVTMNVRVAAVQTKTFLEPEEQVRNVEGAWQYVAEAAKQGAKFICFPETYPGRPCPGGRSRVSSGTGAGQRYSGKTFRIGDRDRRRVGKIKLNREERRD